MFGLRNLFRREGWGGLKAIKEEGVRDMARIFDTVDGAVLYNDGAPIATYSRRRDAIRGAKRRGLTIA